MAVSVPHLRHLQAQSHNETHSTRRKSRKGLLKVPIATKSNIQSDIFQAHLNAQRCRSETEKVILEDLFSSVLSQFKKYHPSENLNFAYLGTQK